MCRTFTGGMYSVDGNATKSQTEDKIFELSLDADSGKLRKEVVDVTLISKNAKERLEIFFIKLRISKTSEFRFYFIRIFLNLPKFGVYPMKMDEIIFWCESDDIQ